MISDVLNKRRQQFGKGGSNTFVNYMVIAILAIAGLVGYVEGMPAWRKSQAEEACRKSLNVNLFETKELLNTNAGTIRNDILKAIRENMGKALDGEPQVTVKDVAQYKWSADITFKYKVAYPLQSTPRIKEVKWFFTSGN